MNELNACYTYINSLKVQDQLLDEGIKKEYAKIVEMLGFLSADILIFIRCELTTRAYQYMREILVSIIH